MPTKKGRKKEGVRREKGIMMMKVRNKGMRQEGRGQRKREKRKTPTAWRE